MYFSTTASTARYWISPARSVPGPTWKKRDEWSPALVDMAETNLLLGEPLPRPDPTVTDPEADLEEPIYLFLTAASQVAFVPQRTAP